MKPYPIDKIKAEIDKSFKGINAFEIVIHTQRAIAMMMFNKMLKED